MLKLRCPTCSYENTEQCKQCEINGYSEYRKSDMFIAFCNQDKEYEISDKSNIAISTTVCRDNTDDTDPYTKK